MATQILPDKLTGGDFMTWLHHFDRCSAANAWNNETFVAKLPAFLHGPAAVFFDSLGEDEKATLPTLLASLQSCFNPAVNREKFYQAFDVQALRPSKDPSLYLWCLKDLLRNAEPDLSDDAFNASLGRQFMKGLPLPIRKLFESDPTPDLVTMVSLAKRFHALHELPQPAASCAVAQLSEISESDKQQQQRLDKLESLVSNMADQQADLIAAVLSLSSAQAPRTSLTSQGQNGQHCFYCQEEGALLRGWNNAHPSIFSVGIGLKCSRQLLLSCEFIGGVQLSVLIATVSMRSILSLDAFQKIMDSCTCLSENTPTFKATSNQCVSVTGQSLSSSHSMVAQFCFPGSQQLCEGEFLTCDNVLQPLKCILGWDFIVSHHLQLSIMGNAYVLVGQHGITPLTLLPSSALPPSPPSLSAGTCANPSSRTSLPLLSQQPT